MNDRLRKVIALMDSSAESEAAAAFRKARALLRQDGGRFRDLGVSRAPQGSDRREVDRLTGFDRGLGGHRSGLGLEIRDLGGELEAQHLAPDVERRRCE